VRSCGIAAQDDANPAGLAGEGIEPALDQAREAACDRDVRIAGGGATILEYLNAGLIDEFSIALSPVLFGSGIGARRLGQESRDPRYVLTQYGCGRAAHGG
jgi:dihydrofolate reductase